MYVCNEQILFIVFLFQACIQDKVSTVEALLASGASVNHVTHESREPRTALHFCALQGHVSCARVLLEHGVRLSIPPGGRYAPLHFAICYDQYDMVELFLKHNASVLYCNINRVTPLQLTCSTIGLYNGAKIIHLLLKNGASPKNVTTPLLSDSDVRKIFNPLVSYISHHEYYEIDVVRALIVHGAEVSFSYSSPDGILAFFHKLQNRPIVMRLLYGAATSFTASEIIKDEYLDEKQKTVLLQESSEPRTLLHQARLNIRRILISPLIYPLPHQIEELPLPQFLKQYLIFKV